VPALTRPWGPCSSRPHPNEVVRLLDDLMAYVNRSAIPAGTSGDSARSIRDYPSVRDGNGRTGRALIHALLPGRGVVPGRDHAAEQWLGGFLEATATSA
jgi:hypothetical protein